MRIELIRFLKNTFYNIFGTLLHFFKYAAEVFTDARLAADLLESAAQAK